MIDLAIHFDGIHPYEIVRLRVPLLFPILLADGARCSLKADVGRHRNVFVLCLDLQGSSSTLCSACALFRSCLIHFAVVDPFLKPLVLLFTGLGMLTFSLIYQLR